jgi:hypothetical protein
MVNYKYSKFLLKILSNIYNFPLIIDDGNGSNNLYVLNIPNYIEITKNVTKGSLIIKYE